MTLPSVCVRHPEPQQVAVTLSNEGIQVSVEEVDEKDGSHSIIYALQRGNNRIRGVLYWNDGDPCAGLAFLAHEDQASIGLMHEIVGLLGVPDNDRSECLKEGK